jgi:hypothetical protein
MTAATLPSPQYRFALIDLTTTKTADAMRPAPAFGPMVAAFTEQINGAFAQAWGANTVAFRIAAVPGDRQPGEIGVNFRDTIPEAPNAMAYHQVVNGVPDIEIGVDLFTSLTTGVESVSVGVSHELLELLQDVGANGWCDKQDQSGEMDAREACDKVQNTFYEASNQVAVTNFLLPSAFIPGAPAPWDYLQVMKAQDDFSQGYNIQAPAPSSTSQQGARQIPGAPLGAMEPPRVPHERKGEFKNPANGRHAWCVGNLSEMQRKRKAHPYSRTYRRGVRL